MLRPNAPRSLFTSLLLIFVLMVLCLVAVAWQTFRQVAAEKPQRQVAERMLGGIVRNIGIPPDLEIARRQAGFLNSAIVIQGPDLQWRSGGQFRIPQSACAEGETALDSMQLLEEQERLIYRQGQYCFYFPQILQPLSDQAKRLVVVGVLGSLLILILAYWSIHRLFRPIRTLKQGVEAVTAGDLAHRVSIDRSDELGDLTRSVNAMTDRLQQMLDAKHHLLLAISHELRSPLTRARVLSEMVSEDNLREKLNADLDRLNRLIGALLEAEHINQRHDALQLSEVALLPLLDDILESYQGQTIVREVTGGPRSLQLDELRVTLMLHNLIENALKYRDGKPVRIALRFKAEACELSVIDEGPGIAEEHLDKIGEAFYRPDTSRNRGTGGYGLGFYLGRLIARAHGGDIRIESQLGQGTVVTVTLPYSGSARTTVCG